MRVYYAGSTAADDSVYQALKLAKDFEIVADPNQADVLVLNGMAPDAERVCELRLQQGAGLVLILGPDLTADQVGTLLGAPVTLEQTDTALSLNTVAKVESSVLQEIVWTSAPQVRERFVLRGATAAAPLVVGFEDQSLILGAQPSGAGQAFVFTPFLGRHNPQLQDWAYFNYFIYHLVERGAGRTPNSFADYAGSPVPHTQEQIVLVAFLGGLLVIAIGAFYFVRRYSLRPSRSAGCGGERPGQF